MRKFLLFICCLPLVGLAQVKSKKQTVKTHVEDTPKAAPGGFLINGTITGYPDGTTVDLLNGQNGQPEQTTSLANGKFSFSGQLQNPDFKLIAFNKAGPVYITMFLDNSTVTITAKKDALDQAIVKGSPTNDDFNEFNKLVKPYESLFRGEGNKDSATMKKVAAELESFARRYKNSYVGPLAIYRNNLLTGDADLMEELYNKLSDPVRTSPIGNYIAQLIGEAKKNPIGKPLADFSQPDTSGHMVSLSSLRGKYVLVDFWASWCGPCRQENPNVLSAYNRYKNKNFTVLGVSLDKAKEPWIKAINDDGLTWTHISDLKFWSNSVAQQFQIQSIPQNFLVDPSGIVIAKNLRGAALDSKLESILK
ncbi:MAG: TlpA disulfide reductase family protein [Ferruginibacter sp.]